MKIVLRIETSPSGLYDLVATVDNRQVGVGSYSEYYALMERITEVLGDTVNPVVKITTKRCKHRGCYGRRVTEHRKDGTGRRTHWEICKHDHMGVAIHMLPGVFQLAVPPKKRKSK